MKRYCLLTLIIVIFTAGCEPGDYEAEKLYWKADRLYTQIIQSRTGSPSPKFDEAIALFQKIYNEYPEWKDAARAKFYAGQLYRMRGDFASAEAVFNQLLEDFPENSGLCVEVITEIGVMFEMQKEWQKTVAQYEKLMKQYPNTLRALQTPLNIAMLYARHGEREKAEAAYNQAIDEYNGILKKYPNASVVWDLLIACYRVQEQWEEVILTYKRMLVQHPVLDKNRAAYAIYGIGEVYEKRLKEYNKALAYYKMFLLDYPDHNLLSTVRTKIDYLELLEKNF